MPFCFSTFSFNLGGVEHREAWCSAIPSACHMARPVLQQHKWCMERDCGWMRGAMTGVYLLNNVFIWHGRSTIYIISPVKSCFCPSFQKFSARFASHLHAGVLEEASRSQSSVPDYNPQGKAPCHAWHLTSAANAVTRHAF